MSDITYDIWVHTLVPTVLELKTGGHRTVRGPGDRFWKGGYETCQAAEEEAARLAIRHGSVFYVKAVAKGETDGKR